MRFVVASVSIITVTAIALACATSHVAKPVSIPAAVLPTSPAPPPDVDYECLQLHSTIDTIMQDARFRWRMGDQSGEGVTHNSWLVIKTTKVHPGHADIEWGPLLDGGDDDPSYPYEVRAYFKTAEDAGTPDQRARRMLHDLGFSGALPVAVVAFQEGQNIDERGLVDGHVPPKTWARLLEIFKETSDDPTAPPQCKD